jgi:hypothetical protein
MNPGSAPSTAYELRTVAFIDILGFSALVSRSTQDAEFLSKLHHALRIVEHQGRAWAGQALVGSGGSQEAAKAQLAELDFRSHAFSDCIVLSQRGAFVALLFISVAQLAMALLDLGVIVRGAVAMGELYHDASVVFGPAIIEAYHLETRCAKFPRILVSESVFAASQEGVIAFPDQGSQAAYRPCDFLRRDADRLYHVDCLTTALLSPPAVIGADHGELARRLRKIAALIREEFKGNTRELDIRAKWGWFLDYFNDFARVRTSHVPELAVQPIGMDDDEMDPAATWEDLRRDFYQRERKD